MKSISRGVGFLVLIFGVGCTLGGYVLANKIGGEGYFQTHAWPLAAAVFAAGLISFVFGRKLNKPARKDANPRRPWTHDFLFLKMETWAYPWPRWRWRSSSPVTSPATRCAPSRPRPRRPRSWRPARSKALR